MNDGPGPTIMIALSVIVFLFVVFMWGWTSGRKAECHAACVESGHTTGERSERGKCECFDITKAGAR